ncbi:hypothetical protein HRI_004635200 [Hibiscus trionum]|uniref:Uncharacterized protein n=1 Tax=Hibiscus trionum TaxID=183268 RepID=A0A9W7J997_HIBTR|nr:hypothetical protein HRI_004635200 [Hibiscus trionum]
MGQSPSAALHRETSLTFLSSSVFLFSEEFLDEIVANRNYTAKISDECLAYVFQFLGPGGFMQASRSLQSELRTGF